MRVGVQCSLAKWIGPINRGFSTTKTCASILSIEMEQWLRNVGLHEHQQGVCSEFSFLDLPLEILFCPAWFRTWNLHMLASRLLRGTVGEILHQTGVSLRGQCCFYCPCGWELVIWLLLLCSGFCLSNITPSSPWTVPWAMMGAFFVVCVWLFQGKTVPREDPEYIEELEADVIFFPLGYTFSSS